MRRSVDIIIPIFNEEGCIAELARRLSEMMDANPVVDWRVLLVENGSSDSSAEKIRRLVESDTRFLEVSLVRNFGTEGGILAGLSVANADAIVTMQGDLEDPPELIPRMVRLWMEGASYVYGEIEGREHLPMWRRLLTGVYYRIAEWASDGAVVRNASDFRLLDRKLYELLPQITDQNLFLRGLVTWAGFPTVGVKFSREPRFAGESSVKALRVIGFAIRGLLAHSSKPLRLITLLGAILSLLSLLGLLFLVVNAVVSGVPFAGFGTIVGFQILFFGLTMLFIGLLAEYVALIYKEVRPRPHFIIDEVRDQNAS